MADILVQATQDGPHWGHVFNISGPTRSLHGIVADLNEACKAVLGSPAASQDIPMHIPVFPRMHDLKLRAHFQRTQQLDDQQIYRRMLGAQVDVNRRTEVARLV